MRVTVLLVAALVVIGAGAPLASAAPATQPASDSPSSDSVTTFSVQENETTENGTADNETENETTPGAQLAGVVGVQGAEVTGEVEQRSFGLQIAAARSNASKASVVANQTEQLEDRIAELQTQKEALKEAKTNGTISRGKYRAKMATLSAQISTLQQLTNSTAETASGLPAEALAENGVDASKVQLLKTSASNLTGPEVASIARNISGPPANITAGQPDNITTGPPENVTTGPPGNVTTGPPDNVTTGPPSNVTTGQPDNKTAGPPDNKTTGPNDNTTTGPSRNKTTGPSDDTTTGPPENKTTGPSDDNTTTGPPGDDTTTGPSGRTTGGPGGNSLLWNVSGDAAARLY